MNMRYISCLLVIMYSPKNRLLPLLLLALCTTVTSCDSSNTSNNNSEITPDNTSIVTPKTQPQNSATSSVQNFSSESNTKALSSKNTSITLYVSDDQCQELLPQKTEVSMDDPIQDAVGKIFKQQNTADFIISGYRVDINNGIATVDLRIDPKSKRQISSLSSCEQFVLFNSVRKTLTSNSQWKIKNVRFTEKGQNIIM